MSRRWLTLSIVVLAVAALIVWKTLEPDATVEVVCPRIQTIRAFVDEQARTELPHDYLVSMPIAGWLQPITLREGDRVQREQVIAQLDTDDLHDRVVQAEQRIAELETKIAETLDHRLENNALLQTEATVKALGETVLASEAKLGATQAVLDFAESELARIRQLHEQGTAPEREVRQAEVEYRKARADHSGAVLDHAALRTIHAVSYIGPKFIRDYIDRKSFTVETNRKQLEQARADLEIARRNLARAEIRSPVDGVVLAREQTRRQYLQAGTPLLVLGRLEDMEVIAEVLSERATRIRPGDSVEIYGEALPGGPLAGAVLRIYPAGFEKISSLGVEQQRVNVAVGLQQRPEGLGVGFRVCVRIIYEQAADALSLPRTAVFRDAQDRWHVIVVRNSRTELREIQVGLMNDDLVQIAAGLESTDAVVLRPSREIVPGMRVRTTLGN